MSRRITLQKIVDLIDGLALSVRKGFDSVEKSIAGVKSDIKDLKEGQKRLERGQEDIYLRLDQKLNKIDYHNH